MKNIFKRPGRVLIVATGILLFGYFALVLLTPQYGQVVGYANEQPPLKVVQPANAAPAAQVEHIRQLAMLHLDCRPDIRQFYWPEPSVIEEHATCWLVVFARKDPIYRLLGFEEAVRPTDRVMFLTIAKQDEAMRFGRWCP